MTDFKPGDLSQKPIEQAETIPSDWYTSSDILALEKEVVFCSHWQLACHMSQLPDKGDMITIEVADNPVLIVRDDSNKVRAFHNVCKHRGGPVAVKKGTTSVLQCQYHGWTYLLDGSLRGVPQFNKVDLFDKKDYGLEPIRLNAFQGLVFINLSNKQEPIKKIVGKISNRLSPINLSNYNHYSDQRYIVDCNWKIYVDNYLEGYHIPIVHPELAKLLDYKNYTVETSPWYSLQYSPMKHDGNLYSEDGGEAFYYFIFPNIMLNILPGRLQTNVVRPITETKTEVLFSYYYEYVEAAESKGIITKDMNYSHDIQLEDIEICESVQKGIQSKAYNKGRFSVEREKGVYHFQSLLKKVFKEAVNHS